VNHSSFLRTLDLEDLNESLPITRVSKVTPDGAPRPTPKTDDGEPQAAAGPLARAENEAPDAACPRCDGTLTDPGGLGWCQKCGYCQSLEEEKARVPVAVVEQPPVPSALGTVEMIEIARSLPPWVWICVGGVFAIVMASFVPGVLLPNPSLPRAAWCTAQIILGLLVIIGAQVWAVFVLAPEDERLGNRDILMPGRLWVLVFRHLPRTIRHVWLGSWGLALVLSALLVVGGLSHWLTYLPKGSH
jgi:hypothetical protein